MYTPVDVINLGLGKLGSELVSTITPGRTSLEKFCANGYVHWKRTEIQKKRWIFAHTFATLTQTAVVTANVARPYQYERPVDCLKVLRTNRTEWQQRGNFLYSAYSPTLDIEYYRDADEDEFDALFAEVLACRCAMECNEFKTQSNTKQATAKQWYDDAVNEAARQNAFILGPQPEESERSDEGFSWVEQRYNNNG